jgi:F0F1-type ATP synthase delta subunit
MKLTPRQYAEGFLDACDGASASEQEAIVARLRARLQRAKALKLFPRIVTAAEDLALRRSGLTRVRVETARAHGADPLAERLKSSIGAVVVDHAVIPELQGGAVVTIGDTRIDGSVATSLRRLRDRLAHSPSSPSHSPMNVTV